MKAKAAPVKRKYKKRAKKASKSHVLIKTETTYGTAPPTGAIEILRPGEPILARWAFTQEGSFIDLNHSGAFNEISASRAAGLIDLVRKLDGAGG